MITNGSPFNLYLKANADRYTISQINNIPTVQSALSIVAALGGCYWADATGKRWAPSLVICGLMSIGSICMAVWNIPEGLKFFAFFIAGLGGALNPLFMSWASEVTFKSAEERAVTIASMNAIGQALLAGLNIVTFPTPQAPRFEFGLVVLIMFLHEKEKRRDAVIEAQASSSEVEAVEVRDFKADFES
jgi:ACS family pantothenate transporter-like MFS transporter